MILYRRYHRLGQHPGCIQQRAQGGYLVPPRQAPVIVFHHATAFIVTTVKGHFDFGAVHDVQPSPITQLGIRHKGWSHTIVVSAEAKVFW
jgi:hypothetical protein